MIWEHKIWEYNWSEEPAENIEDFLDKFGEQGWELVGVVDNIFFFKRRKE